MTRVVVHFDSAAIDEIHTDEEGETWGDLCQRFVETRLPQLPRLPRLLQLLTSLHPDGRMECYRFRYGDDNSTLIRPTWSAAGFNSSAPVVVVGEEEGGAVEANVTLRPREGPAAGDERRLCNFPRARVGDGDGARQDVDLYVEKVVYPRGGGGGHASDGCGRFATTQTPFPVDDGRSTVLRVKEHARLAGVVDRISREGAVGAGARGRPQRSAERVLLDLAALLRPVETVEHGGTAARRGVVNGSGGSRSAAAERREGPAAAAAAAESSAVTAITPRSSKLAKGSGGKTEEREGSPGDGGTNGKKSGKGGGGDGSSKKGTKGDKLNRPPNAYIRFATDVRPRIVADNPGLKATEIVKKIAEAYRGLGDEEKKQYIDAAKEALDEFKRDHPDLPKKTQKSKKKQEEEEPSKEEMELAVASAAKDKNVNEEKEKVNGPIQDKPKRPLNAYIRFSNEVRSKITEENPEASPTEIMSKIAEAYRDLSEDKKKRYEDAAKEAMAKFKEEHGDQALKRGSKKKIAAKDKNVGEEKEEANGPIQDKPKRPPNAYIRFSNEVRSKIKEENPEASPTEMMSKIAEAYRDLSEDKKKPYEDAAKEAMAKFKEEHGDQALKRGKKQVKKADSDGGAKTQDSGSGLGQDLAHVPATPADGLPKGWTTKKMPRHTGSRLDRYWFSPAKSFKFRSMKEVKSFLACLDSVPPGSTVDDAEAAAMEMHLKGEKQEKSKSCSSKNENTIEITVEPGKEGGGGGSDVQDGLVVVDKGERGGEQAPEHVLELAGPPEVVRVGRGVGGGVLREEDGDGGSNLKDDENQKGSSTKKRKASTGSGKKKKKKKASHDGVKDKKSSKKKRKSQASPGKKKKEDDG